MKTNRSAEHERLERQAADELDRALAMTLAGISRRTLVMFLIGVWIAAMGAVSIMRFVAERLHG